MCVCIICMSERGESACLHSREYVCMWIFWPRLMFNFPSNHCQYSLFPPPARHHRASYSQHSHHLHSVCIVCTVENCRINLYCHLFTLVKCSCLRVCVCVWWVCLYVSPVLALIFASNTIQNGTIGLNWIDIPFQIINLSDEHISKIQYHEHEGLSIVIAQWVWIGECRWYCRACFVYCNLVCDMSWIYWKRLQQQ